MTTASDSVATAYDRFAPYYDAFTAGSDYDTWTRHVLALANRLGLSGVELLDLACGTGKSFIPFLERGFRVTGCDLSSAMLAEAHRRAPQVPLHQANLRSVGVLDRFDLVTCFDDSLNYLLDERDLADAFRSMAANLAPNGIALFDLNTLLAYRTTFARDSVLCRDGIVFAWRGEAADDFEPGCRASAQIEVFAPRAGGLYERVSTRHVQRHFPRDRVVALLAEAGLDCVGVYGVLEDGSLVPHANEEAQLKVLYAARPTKGGDAE